MDPETMNQMIGAIRFLPFIVIGIPFAIGSVVVGYAARVPIPWLVLWFVLSLVPLVNYFFFMFLAFYIVVHVIKRLQRLEDAVVVKDDAAERF